MSIKKMFTPHDFMVNLKNTLDRIDSPHGIDHIFSQMKNFLNTTTIQSKEDVVTFFNTLVNYSDQIIAFYFSHPTKNIDNDFAITIKDEDDGHFMSEEGKHHEIIDFLLHDLYDFKDNNFEWQINHKTAFKDDPLTANDISI